MKGKIIFVSFFLFCFSFSNAQTWLWAKEGTADHYGGDPHGGDHSVATDNFGNVYYVGEFYDTLSFGTYKLFSPNTYNSFYVKYDNHGNVRWAKQSKTLINNSSATIYNVATDGSGNSIFAGYFKGTVVFDSDTVVSTSSTQIFILKYDSSGNLIWAQSMANIPYSSMTSDLKGNIYLTGSFKDTLIFGTYILTSPYPDIFLAKFGPSGNVVWAKHSLQWSILSYLNVTSFALNKNGETYITGTYMGALGFGSDTLRSHSTYDYFLIKYDTLGNVNWVRQSYALSPACSAGALSLAIDGSGGVYLTGGFADTVIIGVDTLRCNLSTNKTDLLLAKYDSNGNPIWARQAYIYGTNSWAGFSVACDTLKRGGGYLGLIGSSSSTYYSITMGVDTFTFYLPNYYAASLVLKFDSAGNTQCGSYFSEGLEDDGDGFNVDPSGEHVYFMGDLADTTIFGNDTLPNNSAYVELPFVACWRPCDAPTLGINEVSNIVNRVKVYPNPNNGIFTISLGHAELARPAELFGRVSASQTIVEIYNVMGQKVNFETLNPPTGGQGDYTLNLSAQPNGVYFYRVLSENGALMGDGKLLIEK